MTASITCPQCGRESFNGNDIKYKYCARCGFHDDLIISDNIRVDIKPLSVNDAWQGKRYKSPAYLRFERDFLLMLPRSYPVPKTGLLKINLKWGFSSDLSDWDNPIKPVVDVLQKKYGFNDKRIKLGVVQVEQVKKGREFIEFNIVPL